MLKLNHTRIFISLIFTFCISAIAVAEEGSLLEASQISCGESPIDSTPYIIQAQDDPEYVTHTITIGEETLPLVLNENDSDSKALSLSFTASSDQYRTVLISGEPAEMTLFLLNEGPVIQKLDCEVEY